MTKQEECKHTGRILSGSVFSWECVDCGFVGKKMSAKQEEIREGIDKILHNAYLAKPDIDGRDLYEIFMEKDTPDKILCYLHSRDVAIKANKKLPSAFDINEDAISAVDYQKKLKGWCYCESLIEKAPN